MATHARGLICLCLTPERCDELALRPMTDHNETPLGTAFTVSIEAREGVSTGISAADRARTIQVAIDPGSSPHDLVQPGHVFPLRAKPGGVLQRSGQTEAAVDLARLAGLIPAGIVCEIMNEDGTMARVPDLSVFSRQHDLKMITVADLIEHRRRMEKLVERVVSVRLPTDHGEFQAIAYRELIADKQHVALVKGEVEGAENVLVRVHSECLTGDVFHSLRCDCGEQLELALARIEAEGTGVLLYMAQEGPWNRPSEQAQGVRAAGERVGHGRGKSRARVSRRRTRLGNRKPDPRRSRPDHDQDPHEQPAQAHGSGRVRADRRRAGADRSRAAGGERPLPHRET